MIGWVFGKTIKKEPLRGRSPGTVASHREEVKKLMLENIAYEFSDRLEE